MHMISGRGRKSGLARATEATASLAPLGINVVTATQNYTENLLNINKLYSKMLSIHSGDLRNYFSVYGLYVLPTHW